MVAAVVVHPPVARADGDPASDYLYVQSVFVPAGTSQALESQLTRVVAASTAAGAPIKVAVIGSVYDLGSITYAWHRPVAYAPFLGDELSYRWNKLLLVEMPNGFGVYWQGHSVAAEARALQHVRIASGTPGLIASAERAIVTLAAVRGHPLPPIQKILSGATSTGSGPPAKRSSGGGVSPLVEALVLAAGGILIALCWGYSLRRRPPAGQWVAALRRIPPPLQLPPEARPGRALLALVPVILVAVAVAEFELAGSHPSGATAQQSTPSGGSVNRVQWKAGQRMAPDFDLRDQNGTPVSVNSLRGHVTILAFLDPVCRNLCPLEASALGRVVRRFTTSTRPSVVAISVNPWGDSHANLIRDLTKWNVGPGWRWAIGSRSQLERVWKVYGIGVKIRTIKFAGVPQHEITHVEMIYILDASGHERDAYLYPFGVNQVIQGVRQLEGSSA
jgi:cytochrome oxidase Cu insertion factor (SCO1/SenC/PrrC family)